MFRANNSVKTDEICPLAIPNQMHRRMIDRWMTDGRTETDGHMDGHTDDQRETIIPHVARYKNDIVIRP